MKRISEVSKMVGVSKRTLQYYDDEGLLLVKRSNLNHRLYDEEALERIWQILLYKEMGFELKEIKELLYSSEQEQQKLFERKQKQHEKEIRTTCEKIKLIEKVLKDKKILKIKSDDKKPYTQRINLILKEKGM